jgi:arginyl-tRNA synthetase
MSQSIQNDIREAIRRRVRDLYSVDAPEFNLEYPPKPDLGDFACTVAFALAKILKRNPRQIASEIAEGIELPEGTARSQVAGGGYVNIFLDRASIPRRTLAALRRGSLPAAPGKVIVEHTNINPNKAAHIGHLRNAVLGDTLVRLLRHSGRQVEVQNYIDDTGVQVADLVTGFIHLRKIPLEEIRKIEGRFDYYCWDLYAEVTAWYREDTSGEREKSLRGQTFKRMEGGIDPEASMAGYLSERIVRCHLATMERIGVRYDLLPWESHILAMKFWAAAFEKLKSMGAIRLEAEGPRAGCWVMEMPGGEEGQADEAKIIVRSNGTVTYVGKDIAYQLWKFGLLGSDFRYRPFHTYPDGSVLWSTAAREGRKNHPGFGAGAEVFNVIDVRQSYLQRVVTQGLMALGHDEEASRSRHFAYEMVALSAACARTLGYAQDTDSGGRAVEMSGRKGTGVKADDLLDALEKAAAEEVSKRAEGMPGSEIKGIAERVAVGALRYFMIRFTRTSLIAFDFDEVLSFEGETGPYILYAAVRAGNILKKLRDRTGMSLEDPETAFQMADWSLLEAEPADDHWELMALLSRFDDMATLTIRSQEPATFARYLFVLAQKFNHFYHRFSVIQEADEGRRAARACLTWLFREHMKRGCDLIGVEVPPRM